MYDPNDEAYLAKLSGSPLAAPDDAYSANLQAYLAAQNALPRVRDNEDASTLIANAIANGSGMGIPEAATPVAEAVTPAVKKAVKKLKKVVAADYPENSNVRNAVAPVTNAQGNFYPPVSTLVPDAVKQVAAMAMNEQPKLVDFGSLKQEIAKQNTKQNPWNTLMNYFRR